MCVFHVRRGRIVGRRAFIVDKVEDLTRPQLVGRVLEQLYGDAEPPAARPGRRRRVRGGDRRQRLDVGGGGAQTWGTEGPAAPGVPRQVLVPELPDDADVYSGLPGRPARRRRWPCGCPSGAASAA